MSPQTLDTWIELAAAQAGLILEPEWRDAVMRYYHLASTMAETLAGHPLPIEEEPAPVFVA